MDDQDLRDRIERLDAALVDIDTEKVKATRSERTYLQGARDALQALVDEQPKD